MRIGRNISLLLILLLIILISQPAHAQMGQGKHQGAGMGSGMIKGYDYAQHDSRFNGFGSMTFKEVSDTFGISAEDAAYDLDLPEDMDTRLTVIEIEELYGVSGQKIASYMVLNMQEMSTSLNASEKILMRQQAVQSMRAGKGKGMFFVRQGNFACGNFTTFNFNRSGIINNFAVGGNLLFDSVKISDFEYLDEQITDTTAFYQDVESQIFIQDFPTGIFQIRAFANKTVTFNLAEKVKANLEKNISSGHGYNGPIKVTAGNLDGYLLFFRNPCSENPDQSINGTKAIISGNKITVNLVPDSVVMFRASPVQPLLIQKGYRYSHGHAHMNRVLNRETATGKLGAEITFSENSDKVSITNYAPVNLKLRERDRDRIVLCIESELSDGRAVNINMDEETINLTDPGRLRIRCDGEIVEETSSIDELFDNMEKPVYYSLEEKGTASIAVYVPEISGNEIIIDLVPETEDDTAGVLGIKNTAISKDEAPESGEDKTSNEEARGSAETDSPDEEKEAESSPAFESGLAVAVIAAAYKLRCRK